MTAKLPERHHAELKAPTFAGIEARSCLLASLERELTSGTFVGAALSVLEATER